MPELLQLVSDAVADSDLSPEQVEDVGAGVFVAIAAWATSAVEAEEKGISSTT